MVNKQSLKERVNALPFTPGVYFMKDENAKILYIGKARSLKKRVRSYLANTVHLPKITILMRQVIDVDYIETSTEVDALLLEADLCANLILQKLRVRCEVVRNHLACFRTVPGKVR